MVMAAPRPAWVPQELYPFDSRYVDIDGNRIHYVDEGSGPTILFLHGNPTWSFLYRNIVLGLRDEFRCIALDYPGFGLSTAHADFGFTAAEHADAVEQFVTQLDLHDVTVMGQDWGGPIGLTVACRHPHRFSGFILGNTWAWPLNGGLSFEVFARVLSGPVGRVLIRRANAFVNVMIPLGTASRVPPEVMAAYRGPFPDSAARRATSEFPAELLRSEPFMQELAGALGSVTDRPALFVWGGGDFALRASVELPRFEQLFADHHTVVLDRAKHFFQEDEPEAVVRAIRTWMSTRSDAIHRGVRHPHTDA
jgi:haloalkane dehalogenase